MGRPGSTKPHPFCSFNTCTLTDRSFENQKGEDDSTFDGHRDFKSAAVSNDNEPGRHQEVGEKDGDDDDELGEIILPHDFHGLFTLPKMPKMVKSHSFPICLLC